MIRIAIVEDDPGDMQILQSFLTRYAQASGEEFQISSCQNGLEFINHYQPIYDLIFLDIEMPYLNGMDTAGKLRSIDAMVQLIFVTRIAKYAINGYAVNALDYILKPLDYSSFCMKLQRAIHIISMNSSRFITVPVGRSLRRINLRELKYIEVKGHYLTYHLSDAQLVSRGKISVLEASLAENGFARCNQCYLVNLQFVTGIDGQTLKLGATELPISRSKSAEFLERLSLYLGGDLHP